VRYRTLGRTGITVSEIGFGAWGIGGRTGGTTSYGDTDDATSLTALRRALDCGITFYDTSPAYGDGHSEALIGEAFAGQRDRVVVASKAGYESWGTPADFSPAALVSSAEKSLVRLRSDYLDLLQLHNPPVEALRDGALQHALRGLQQAGKIRSWGVSAKSPVEATEALVAFAAPVVQANFNMMDVRVVESGLLDEAVRRGAGFIARTPLCFGFLSGTIRRDTVFPPGDHRLGWSRAQIENWIDGARDLLAAAAAQPGREAAQAALRFCLAPSPVSTVIPGILTAAEAEDNAIASEAGPLEDRVVEAIIGINRTRRFFVSPARGAA
jgi:aryl-alcohol dehydrogenase-like predicted oxidoreductase